MIVLWSTLLSMSWAAPQVQVLAHERAVVGQPIQVLIRVENLDPEPTSHPDISNRPWLVRFETIDPSGVRRQLFSTAPEQDSALTWTLQQGHRREALFEIPSSGTWSTGDASVSVHIEDKLISEHRFSLFEVKPDHQDNHASPVDQQGEALPTLLTIHRGQHSELWLRRDGRTEYLTTADGIISPQLSVARADRRIGRWVTWSGPEGTLWALRTQLRGAQDPPFKVSLPWPDATACGRPATDGQARLVQPVCIPGPGGKNTRLIAAIVTGKGAPTIRSIAQFQPKDLLTNVDSAGQVDLVLVRDQAIDLATLDTDNSNQRPVRLDKLWRSKTQRVQSAGLIMSSTTPASPAVKIVVGESEDVIILPLKSAE